MLKSIIFFLVLNLCCVARTASITLLSENIENVDRVTISGKNNKLNSICVTEDCMATSAYIQSLLDESIDPCDDLYQFACGTFLKNDLPDDKKELTNFVILQQKVYQQLYSVLSEPIHANDSKTFALAKTYFGACMNKEAAEMYGIEYLIEKIEQFGGWPVVKGDAWNSANFNWISLLKNFSEYGFETNQIVQFHVTNDWYNSSRNIIYIISPKLNLKYSFLRKLREPYRSFMVDVAVMMGANRSRAEIEMADALSFEEKLLNATVSSKRITIKDVYNVMTIGQLQRKYPYFDWLEYVRVFTASNVIVDENELVALGNLDFFARISNIFQNMKNNRTICNYLIWRSIFPIAKYLNKEMRELSLKFSEILDGKKKQELAHIECIAYTTESLPMPVGELYVSHFFDDLSKINADQLVTTILDQFTDLLANNEFMDATTRNEAIEKVKFMKSFVAYPNASDDNFNLNEYYEELELNADNFAENYLRISHFNRLNEFLCLHEPVDGPEILIREKTALVDAFYSALDNSVLFTTLIYDTKDIPAAILQQPFFDAKWPSYVNYAKIGQFIGHEITHGLDDFGRAFDRFGGMKNWWKKDTEYKYREKSKCFEEQFSAFETAAGDKLDGENTLNENIADSGGIKVAYNAYQHFVEQNGAEPLLSGLNYTQNQLFWISSAQAWCAISRPEHLKTFVAIDEHAPYRFRAIGTAQNMPKFAEDFKCSIGSDMNPSKRCQLW